MPRYEQAFSEVCRLANSTRITEKKQSMVRLSELYDCKEALEDLDEMSRDKKDTNWSTVMYSVHNLLKYEAEKVISVDDKRSQSASTSKSSKTKDAQESALKNDYSSTMLETIKRANSSAIFLKCKHIVPLVLEIFYDERYAVYRQTYLGILVDHLLLIREHQSQMSYQHWKELQRVCINSYETAAQYHLKKDVILKALCALVQHGCRQSHLALRVKNILPFLIKVFNDAKASPRNLSESCFKLANVVCQQIGPESRRALCEFGESIMQLAIDLNSSSDKYDWILLIVRAHHPGSVTKDHEAAYACDWEKWTNSLRSIYCRVINDCKSDFSSDSFVQLACEVSWQLKDDHTCIDDNIKIDESCYSQPPKRRKIVIGISAMIDVLTTTSLREYEQSIKILIEFVTKYPESMKGSNFLLLMDFLIGYLGNCDKKDVEYQLWELGRVMVELDEKISSSPTNNEVTHTWDKLWDISLRSLVTNGNEGKVHEFSQCLIKHKKVIDSNGLLNLYLKDTITWSKSSIRTLLVFCKHNVIQNSVGLSSNENNFTSNNENPVKVRLLRWVLAVPPDKWNSQLPVGDICELVVGLTLKSWYNTEQSNVPNISHQLRVEKITDTNSEIDQTLEYKYPRCDITDMERVHLLTALEGNLCHKTFEKRDSNNKEVRDNVMCVKEYRDLLIKDLIEQNVAISDLGSTHAFILQTAVISKVISNLERLKLAHENMKETLGSVVKNLLEEVSLTIEEITTSKKKPKWNNLANVLDALCILFKTRYENDIMEIIISSTKFEILTKILRLTKLEITGDESAMGDHNTSVVYLDNMNHLSERHRILKENDDFQEINSLSDTNNIRMKACSVLGTFCAMVNGNAMSKIQENLQVTLLKTDYIYDLEQMCDFKMALTVLELLINSELTNFSENITGESLKLLQELCCIWHKDEEAARKILNILRKLFFRLNTFGGLVQQQNSLRILASFHKLLQDNKYGPMVYITFIECLETIAKIDPAFSWAMWKCDTGSEYGNETPVVEELIAYIQNPFHVVRLKAISCLHTIFTSNNVDFEWLKEFLSKLRRAMNNLLIVKQEVKEKVKEDERENRIASSLHIMTSVVLCSPIFRSEALSAIFRFAVDKNVDSNIVNKVLHRIGETLKMKRPNSLVEDNMNYLITHWLEDGYCLDKFPMSLTLCESDKEFYQKYIDIIVPVIVQKGSLQDVQDLCNEFGIPFKQAIERSFPHLISWLLPHVSLNPPVSSPGMTIIGIRHATEVFNKLLRNENEFQRIQKMSVLVGSNLESIILTLIKRLHDEKDLSQFLTIPVHYPSSDPPHFEYNDIKRSFKYLEDQVIGTSRSLIHILVTEKQVVLQKVLLDLKSSIYKSSSAEHKLKALHHYVYFSMMMLEEIECDYFDEMAAYVVRDICYTLVQLMNESSDLICQAACSYLYHFLERMLPNRYREFQQNLRLIMTTIIPVVKAGRIGHACDVMNFLIVKQNDVLGDAIERLDSFPVDAVFKEVREIHTKLTYKMKQKQCLENEIQDFLNIRGESADNCSVNEIDHLTEQLSRNKTGLKELYQRLGSVQRFSEDCVSSILHQLICALVKLSTSSDHEVSLSAVKSLGELGPADLSTMILQPDKAHTRKPLSDPMLAFTYKVLILLSNFLVHSNVELFTASSETLYIVMSSSWGRKISVEKNMNELKKQIDASQELLQIEYIRPFVSKSKRKNETVAIDEIKFIKWCVENAEIWTGKLNSSHSDWITDITCQILDCFSGSYLNNLIPVCRANVSFCETILPWIIHLILHTEKKFENKIFESINRFFDFYFTNSSEIKRNLSQNNAQKKTCFNYRSIQCMLDVVDFIRSQSPDKCRFGLNYLHIAKAAQSCSAYFTSVLYAELWCEQFLRENSTSDYLTPIDYVCEIEPDNGKVLQKILKDACIKIGDPDAIYGCGTSYFQNPSAKIEHYVQLRKWDKVLLTHDVELSLGNKTATKGLLDALQHSGLQYLLGAFVRTIKDDKQDVDDVYQYECAWRLSDWNMPSSERMINLRQDNRVDFDNIVSNDYPLFHYHALKSFHEDDKDGMRTALASARVSIIKALRNISLESCKTVYPVLSKLQMLREIEEIYYAEPDEYQSIIEKWHNQDSIGVNDFEYIEPILSQRTVILQANEIIQHSVVKNALTNTYLQVSEFAQKDGYFQIAARALGSLSKQVNLSAETANILQYEEAILAWMSGDHELGRHLLHNLIAKDSLNLDIRAQALKTYGNWMAETKSENPQKVISKYYLKSLMDSEKIKNPTKKSTQNMLDTNAALAQFADAQYQQILTYMKSPQFESFKECVSYSDVMAGKLAVCPKNNDEKLAARLNRMQSSNDMVELENIEKEKNMYLLLALKHYIIALKKGEDHNLLIFRLVSLWLDNTQHKDVIKLLELQLKNLPSYKFILLVPQLAPHMTTNSDEPFSVQIYNLLWRCALEHPHHTLPVLLALMNSYKDNEFYKSKSKSSNNPEPRVIAAKKLIENLEKTQIKPIIQEMHKLDYSLIMLANLETAKGNFQQIPVPNIPNSVVRIKNFEHALIPTLSIDIKPDKNYDRIVSIKRYEVAFDLVGGVNAPKKISCYGTDGIKRNQLVKGKDDLRQDAVMQQVFTVMNILLKTSKEAVKRKLSVRTYKVVPLTRRCGILEWCDNTMPIGAILEGSQGCPGLHERYYPRDWTTKQCRRKMEEVSKKSNDEKLGAFMDCCKHLHPVLHYFFLESFTSPEIWFERRLAYVHSVATTSIIGYILGLGDRHVNNILIDKSTAELIHIDLGIAFEQGKILPTPETVPFRLTRDIEVAMGVSGVEGVLRRSCEETMAVLRHHREVLITLLQVLLYDPLVSWAMTPARAYSLQKGEVPGSSERGDGFGETNKLAERALLRLDQKLRGTEEGSASSVAGQVEKLIQAARDPANLSRLYFGWQSYL